MIPAAQILTIVFNSYKKNGFLLSNYAHRLLTEEWINIEYGGKKNWKQKIIIQILWLSKKYNIHQLSTVIFWVNKLVENKFFFFVAYKIKSGMFHIGIWKNMEYYVIRINLKSYIGFYQ